MTDTIVGIDGGGTKTRALCRTLSGEEIREAVAGPCTLAAMTASEACETIASCVDQLGIHRTEIVSLCAAVAGWSFEKRRNELRTALQKTYPRGSISLIPDFEAAFRNAQPGNNGIHIIAGTGSVTYGVNSRSKQSHRAGGYGYLIDDAGSGYGVGRSAIASILRQLDGSGPKTSLTGDITQRLGLGDVSWESVIEAVYGGSAGRVTIASLASVVVSAADSGDEVAQHILFRAGGALARLAEAVYTTLFVGTEVDVLDGKQIAFSRSGGLWQAGGALSDVFERSVARFAPGVAIGNVADVDCALGALTLAGDNSGTIKREINNQT